MEYITFDFYNDTKEKWLECFCEYFNLNLDKVNQYFNNFNEDEKNENNVIQDLNINLKKAKSSNVKIIGRHMTTSTSEDLKSFEKYGLMDLKFMLECDTPLSEFLARYEIKVDVNNKKIIFRGEEYPILEYRESCPRCFKDNKNIKICNKYSRCELKKNLELLASKLYNYGATLEFFIMSNLSVMQKYSTICRYPEILETINGICRHLPNSKFSPSMLGIEWANEKNKCYVIEFPAILSNMETYAPMDYESTYYKYSESFDINGYTYIDYMEKNIPQNVLDNIILIQWFIQAYFGCNEKYGSLLPNKYIKSDDIIIKEVNK
ncbi:hypothetical protein QTI89_12015 [Clostridium perfringens]|nr:hypothetical protein [Clostridium perfringens]